VSAKPLRIGEAAARAGVSRRTLRYYQELGLLEPTERTPGGARRYSEDDVAVVLRIRELQEVMGFDLDAIRVIVAAEVRLQRLRAEYRSGRADRRRRRQIVLEAMQINDELREQVRSRLKRTRAFLSDLDHKADRYREVLAELDEGKRPAGARR
jgi:DNA-binding transcriptional MerR regulator